MTSSRHALLLRYETRIEALYFLGLFRLQCIIYIPSTPNCFSTRFSEMNTSLNFFLLHSMGTNRKTTYSKLPPCASQQRRSLSGHSSIAVRTSCVEKMLHCPDKGALQRLDILVSSRNRHSHRTDHIW